MAEICNGHDVSRVQLAKRQIAKRPLELICPGVNAIKGHTIAKKTNPQVIDQRKIFLPSLVVLAFFQFVDPAGRYLSWASCSRYPWQT
jgi:hypothetical protein